LGDYQGIYAAIFGCVNDCYIELSGTSMATPYVAGVVALMLEANPTMTPAQVAQALYATAQDHSPVPGKDNATGHGLVDAFAAVERAALGGVFSPTAFPTFVYGSDTVSNGGEAWIPIEVTDTSAPLAVTITIDGQFKCFSRLGRACLASGWTPDLEAQLYDPDMNPYEEPNPLYPWLSPDPTIAVSGTQSTCPAGNDCGQAGVQETLYFRPPTPGTYWVRVYPFDGAPNNGTGGSFSYQISRGPAAEPINSLIANAGSDQSVTDGDKDGVEMVTLDGGASGGPITGYLWTDETGATVSTEATVTLSLAVGTYLFNLTVDDGSGGSASDAVSISVVTSKKGGGGNGGGGNGGGGGPKPKGGKANGT
jgi:serine protease AprX